MSSHGHVIPNADGSRARCGGPGLCAVCSREAAQELPRLRAELAKARAERDEARMEVIDSPFCDEALSQQARAERAEAELARVRDDRDALHAEFDGTRAELAQARAERDALRAKLRAIVEWLERNRPEVWREGMWDAIRAARSKEHNNLRHVCGGRGYDGMTDPARPACEQSRNTAAAVEAGDWP